MSNSAPDPTPRPAPPRTPATEIDGALQRLEGLHEQPLAEQVAIFTAVHDALAGQLSAAEG